jgi:heme a synthase
MANATLISEHSLAVVRSPSLQRRLAFFAFGLAFATLMLMALGSATRVMNAGLSCPDWPLCYGTLLPQKQMNLQVFLEWFHRLVASVIGFGTIVFAAVSWRGRSQLPRWTPWMSVFALGLVLVQGLLGGLTVTELLRFDIVTAHLGTGLAFFSTVLTIGLMLWEPQPRPEQPSRNQPSSYLSIPDSGSLRWWGLSAAIAVYGQSLLGGLVASRWAVHQCFGMTQLCGVLNRHLLGIIPATGFTLITLGYLVWRSRRSDPLDRRFTRLGWAIGGLLTSQLLLGLATFRLRLQVEPLTVAHQAIGAALLGSLIALTVLAFKSPPTTAHQ